MRILLVFASIILAITASSDRELWQEFKAKHGKSYRSLLEEQQRFGIFQTNLRTIEQHNANFEKGETSYTMGVNQFADMTPQEFKKIMLRANITRPDNYKRAVHIENRSTPDSIDWRNKGAVTGVKDQGDCGDCWAFSTTASIESAYYLKNGELVTLSEQDLVDCSTRYGNDGCDGGLMYYAYDYIVDHGIAKASDYPYTGKDDTCKNVEGSVKISSYVIVDPSESALKAAVAERPVAVALDADRLQFYSSGVYEDSECTKNLDHEVLAVGYGSADGKDYWLLKNSWGTDWGESGYIKLARNSNDLCGIADCTGYPIL